MTNSSQDIHPYRGNKSDATGNFREEGLILADLHTTTDDSGLQIEPLRHWQDDEEAMGRLLINTGFEGTAAQPEMDSWTAKPETRPQTEKMAEPATDKTSLLEASVVLPAPHSRIEPRLDGIGLTEQANRHRVTLAESDDAVKNTSATPVPVAVPPEIPVPFVVESFVASHQAMRADFNAGQNSLVDDGIARIAEEPVPDEGQQEHKVEPMGSAPETIAEPITAITATRQDKLANVGDVATTEQPGLSADQQQHQQGPAATIQLPVWAATLTIAVLLSLLAAIVSLVLTVSTLKTEVGRLSALMAIVKDDVEVLGQK